MGCEIDNYRQVIPHRELFIFLISLTFACGRAKTITKREIFFILIHGERKILRQTKDKNLKAFPFNIDMLGAPMIDFLPFQ